MLTVAHTNCASTGELLDRALTSAEFYGFDSFDHVLKQHKPIRVLKQNGTPSLSLPTEKKLSSITKSLVSHGLHRADCFHFAYQLENNGSKVSSLGLHAIGSRSAIAEGMILATLANIVREAGIHDFVVHINSLGDRDSSARFVRELTNYLRSHMNDLPCYAREDMQSGNPIRAFSRLAEKDHEIALRAPNPMEYLNDDSRAHLRSVLEYTEHMEVPYELDTTIVGNNDCWQHTIFELRTTDDNGNSVTIARGGRHDALAQKTFRVDLPMVSAVIEHEIQGRIKPKRRNVPKPKFFFAQLGPDAKKKSFSVLKQLQESEIPVMQRIVIESIGSQLEHADKHEIPYTIIIGHKEALEDTAIVRNMNSRSQVVVPLTNLPGYLKRLRIA